MKISPRYLTKKHFAIVLGTILGCSVFLLLGFVLTSDAEFTGLRDYILTFLFFMVFSVIMVGGISLIYIAQTEREKRGFAEQVLFFVKTGKGSRIWLFFLRISPQWSPRVSLLVYMLGMLLLYGLPFLNIDLLSANGLILKKNAFLLPTLPIVLSLWVLIQLAVRERARYFLEITAQDLAQKSVQLGSTYGTFLQEGITFLNQSAVARWDPLGRKGKQLQILEGELRIISRNRGSIPRGSTNCL